MRKVLLIAVLFAIVAPCYAQGITESGNAVTCGNARFTVISPNIVRMEYSPDGTFVDAGSAVVPTRAKERPEFMQALIRYGKLSIKTNRFELLYTPGAPGFTVDTLSVKWGQRGKWLPGQTDLRNLGGSIKSLDGVADSNLPPLSEGALSRSGYYLYDDSKGPLYDPATNWIAPRDRPNAVDWYLIAYGGDYQLGLREYASLFGAVPMIPRYALGSWYSRYWPYHDHELKDIVNEYRGRQIPMDVLVVDVDWHTNGWEGYDWNKEYFPDPVGFMKWCHDQGLMVTLNTHPGVLLEESKTAEVRKAMGLGPKDDVRFNLAKKVDAYAYMDILHNPMLDDGVDFWWIDGESAYMDGLNNFMWTNKVYYDQQQEYTKDIRSLIFGRWGNTGSHRYPIGFSGDTIAGWGVLKYEVATTSIAGNVLWEWSHDIGGFHGDKIDDELYVRWVQFGAFSPFLRMHSNHGQRLPWEYGEDNAKLAGDAFRMRYRLIPYIYTAYRELYDSAVSPCRPLYVQYPDLGPVAYEFPYEYNYGSELLVAPTFSHTENGVSLVPVYLPPGIWHDFTTGRIYEGDKTIVYAATIDRIPVFAKAGAIVPMQPEMQYTSQKTVDPLTVNIYRGADGDYTLYEDDGISMDYAKNAFARTRMTLKDNGDRCKFTIHPRQGTYAGAPSSRGVVVRIFGAAGPTQVALNGDVLDAGEWRIDPKDRALEIPITAVKPTDTVTVEVEAVGGFSAYRWLRQADEIAARLATVDPANELVTKLLRDARAIASGESEPRNLAPRLPRAAMPYLASDTTADRENAEAILGFAFYSEVLSAPEIGRPASVVAATSWDPDMRGTPMVAVTPPSIAGWTKLQSVPGTTDTYARYLLPQKSVDGFKESALTVTASADVLITPTVWTKTVKTANYSVTKWKLAGPFDSGKTPDLDKDWGPEKNLDLSSGWTDFPAQAITGDALAVRYMDLRKVWERENVCVYAHTTIYSDSEQKVRLEMGSDDQMVVWLNGVEIDRAKEPRPAEPGQDVVEVTLKKGENDVLLKVFNLGGQWGFYFEVKSLTGGIPYGIEVR